MLSPLWTMALTVVLWSPQSFRNDFVTLSTQLDVNDFVSQLSFRSQHVVYFTFQNLYI